MENVEYVYTVGMDAETVDRRLAEHEVGVLALADGGAAYAIPVGYHYDGETLVVRLADDGSSTKMDYVESTSEACLCLYRDGSGRDSWSVLARGRLRRLEGPERASFDATALNEAFHRLYVFDQDPDAIELALYELELRSLTGRRTPE